MDGNLFYATAKNNNYLNIARDLARVNARNEEITTRDGHVQGYACRFTIHTESTTPLSVSLLTAPNTWKMRNAFRKFHAYRDIMFDNAGVEGVEKGKYGMTIRPYFDDLQKAGTTLDPLTYTSAMTGGGAIPVGHSIDGGEWTYSQLAVTPTYTDVVPVSTTEEYWADAFDLHICEPNTVSGSSADESGYYKSVGMIHSYNLDRQEVSTPTETIEGPSNPLSQLISSGNQAVGEVVSIAKDQELEAAPYDLDDNGDSIHALISSYGIQRSTGGTVTLNAFVPAGLCRLLFSADPTSSAIEVEVLGKILCKDLA